MKFLHLIGLVMGLALAGSPFARGAVVDCQEQIGASGRPEYKVKFVGASPLAILACVGGAGKIVLFSEGDADEILARTAPAISGEIKGIDWLDVANKVIAQTNDSMINAKITARLKAEIREYEEAPAATASEATTATPIAKRKLFYVTGVLIKPPAPKERITFFNKKEDQ